MLVIHDLSILSKSTASVKIHVMLNLQNVWMSKARLGLQAYRPIVSYRSIYRRAARAAAAETSQTPEAAQRHLLQVLEELPPAKFFDVLIQKMYANAWKYPLENVKSC